MYCQELWRELQMRCLPTSGLSITLNGSIDMYRLMRIIIIIMNAYLSFFEVYSYLDPIRNGKEYVAGACFHRRSTDYWTVPSMALFLCLVASLDMSWLE